MPASQIDFNLAVKNLIETGKFLNNQGWIPATSGNFSQRLDGNRCAITVSGRHKGDLKTDDIMIVDLEGKPISQGKASAETLLHTSLYSWDHRIGTILHTHSLNATLLTKLIEESNWQIEGYELQKAFTGISTHESKIHIPIFENNQDISTLAKKVISSLNQYLNKGISTWAYLIRGHGIYVWGLNLKDALRHLEAMEYLIQCELELMRIKAKT